MPCANNLSVSLPLPTGAGLESTKVKRQDLQPFGSFLTYIYWNNIQKLPFYINLILM